MSDSNKLAFPMDYEADRAADDALFDKVRAERSAAKKSADDTGPAPLPDPLVVGFTDEELDALTETDNEASGGVFGSEK